MHIVLQLVTQQRTKHFQRPAVALGLTTSCCWLPCVLQAKPSMQGRLTRKEFNDVLDK